MRLTLAVLPLLCYISAQQPPGCSIDNSYAPLKQQPQRYWLPLVNNLTQPYLIMLLLPVSHTTSSTQISFPVRSSTSFTTPRPQTPTSTISNSRQRNCTVSNNGASTIGHSQTSTSANPDTYPHNSPPSSPTNPYTTDNQKTSSILSSSTSSTTGTSTTNNQQSSIPNLEITTTSSDTESSTITTLSYIDSSTKTTPSDTGNSTTTTSLDTGSSTSSNTGSSITTTSSDTGSSTTSSDTGNSTTSSVTGSSTTTSPDTASSITSTSSVTGNSTTTTSSDTGSSITSTSSDTGSSTKTTSSDTGGSITITSSDTGSSTTSSDTGSSTTASDTGSSTTTTSSDTGSSTTTTSSDTGSSTTTTSSDTGKSTTTTLSDTGSSNTSSDTGSSVTITLSDTGSSTTTTSSNTGSSTISYTGSSTKTTSSDTGKSTTTTLSDTRSSTTHFLQRCTTSNSENYSTEDSNEDGSDYEDCSSYDDAGDYSAVEAESRIRNPSATSQYVTTSNPPNTAFRHRNHTENSPQAEEVNFWPCFGSSPNSSFYETVVDVIRNHGYAPQAFRVRTDDGYLLCLHRIAHGRNTSKPAVLLQHGIPGSSADWLLAGRPHSLAYLLADAGYDVWLSNFRGNNYSLGHENLDTEGDEFWSFSLDEMAAYDMPAVLDFILYQTQQSTIHVVTQSTGSAVLLAMLSSKTCYNQHIRAAYHLAPAVFLTNNTHFLKPHNDRSTGRLNVTTDLLEQFGLQRCLSHRETVPEAICKNLRFLIGGYSYCNTTKELLAALISHSYAGTSEKAYLHYSQILSTGKLRQFDYGHFSNLKLYGRKTPPEYDLGHVTIPNSIFYSELDPIVGHREVNWLAHQLPNVMEIRHVPYFTHWDFLWDPRARTDIYNHILHELTHLDHSWWPQHIPALCAPGLPDSHEYRSSRPTTAISFVCPSVTRQSGMHL